MTQLNEASKRQIAAANPAVSTWLSANAGSGKTRVLTDRVARLLLENVSPQNILCLTYTKAAATEMQNRLFKRLGAWAMKDDNTLRAELAELGVNDIADPERLAHARTLFARAIETPGGLKIQTIHSFCSSLLRRFPLEAGVSPVFTEIEERSAKLLREDVVEQLATGPDAGKFANVASYYSGEDFSKLTAEIVRNKTAYLHGSPITKIWDQFGLPTGYTRETLSSEVFLGDEEKLLTQLIGVLNSEGSVTDRKAANLLSTIDLKSLSSNSLEPLISVFLSGPKTKVPNSAKVGRFPTKKVAQNHPELIASLEPLMLRVEAARERYFGLYSAEKSKVMCEFANVFLAAYEAHKEARGWLDFDDLIIKARALLTDPDVAQWVLFRLDGGLDHILVDEAQDTSPEQWKVIELLAQEFTSGRGARTDHQRTIFVVGDKKQSIYSFQGADPKAFDRMKHHFENRLSSVEQQLHDRSLDHSFRSSHAILKTVDAVFQQTDGRGIGGVPNHIAFQDDLPGRVDLWPVVEKTDEPEEREWFDPTDKLAVNDPQIVLADHIAQKIETLIKTGSIPDDSGSFRDISAGDFLILVQRRSPLFHEIIRACKNRNLPIAGADRLKIGAELAVKDIVALLSFLSTPEDDLSLAAALRSPLFGLSENQLFKLAYGRNKSSLWSTLIKKQDEYPGQFETLIQLRNATGFMGPYDLIERILTRFNGRERLLARLGAEAEDGIDALLNQALSYERAETPSLTGFVTWIEAGDVEIKRQAESAGDKIRVMTTHGAKGLEAPIVILPDTAKRQAPPSNDILSSDDGIPLWRPPADKRPDVIAKLLAEHKTRQEEERMRLLYVALTRAETWLIMCAAGDVGEDEDSWFSLVKSGLETLGAATQDQPTGRGLRYQHGTWDAAMNIDDKPTTQKDRPKLDWLKAPAPAPIEDDKILIPSGLGGAKVMSGDHDALDETAAKERGNHIHLLLEHLPTIDPKIWQEFTYSQLSTLSASNADTLLTEVQTILQSPDLKHLFASNTFAEVGVSATLPDHNNRKIHGIVDRLIVTDTHVLVVDYKSNALIPTTPTDTPEGLLRQMGAYQIMLQQIYPNHQIDTAILWTRSATLMPLPHNIVRDALLSTTIS